MIGFLDFSTRFGHANAPLEDDELRLSRWAQATCIVASKSITFRAELPVGDVGIGIGTLCS